MNHSELKETRKVREKGEKRPLSHGLMLTPSSQQAARDNIQRKTDAFLAGGGKVEHVASNVMKADAKGHTALRIKPERDVEGFEAR